MGWSNSEQAVFIQDDGSVLLYDLFGVFVRTFQVGGQEAKDLKLAQAKIFRGPVTSGLAVVTNSGRFYIVNNLDEPRVKKMPDVDWNPRTGADPSKYENWFF